MHQIRFHLLIRDTLLINGILFLVIGLQYIGYPLAAGLIFIDSGFFAYLLFLFSFISLLGSIFYRKHLFARLNMVLVLFTAVLYFFIFAFLNGPFNILVATLMIFLLVLNVASFVLYSLLLSSPRARLRIAGARDFFTRIDFKESRHRMKITVTVAAIFTIFMLGYGTYTNWNAVIVVKAPDGFTTTSSYWGPPSLQLTTVTGAGITAAENHTLLISNGTVNVTMPNFKPGGLAYVTNVSYLGNTTNFCNYSEGARSYPNGSIYLSQELPFLENISVDFKYVDNIKLLENLNASQSTLIMNHHSSGHPTYPNGYWFYDFDFFDSIEKTYLYQILDYWAVKYYQNIHNGIDFPHVFNSIDTIPLCYAVLDWFDHQRSFGLGTMFQGISPDFESGDHDKLFLDTYNTSAVELFPGSLIPGIISDSEWYSYNSQDPAVFNAAVAAWEAVYDHASSLGYSTYVVFQGGAMRDTIDNDIEYTRLPIFPASDNPDVRFGIMSYQDGQSDVEGGRFSQYRDCMDQIALYGDRGRSILTGWIAANTSWYTDDELGLGRYIEDILICQAAGMNEIFHAPLYRMQAKWGDDAVRILHEALNEWEKQEFQITVPMWEYKANYIDAIQNLDHPWQFLSLNSFIIIKMGLFGTVNLVSVFKKQQVE
ncbi:hypothetical protein GF325_17870 [Candidatus Bathyarchaeota archaeon]|nr:hypothetical protein [Candidatus Bathyarchaeota archaeon]